MKLSAIALKNLKRNFSFYFLYLFSVSFVLMIYFCFTSFSMNQIIMEKISSDGRVETMCRTVAVFIMVFVIFYMFYSNSFFMRRRMRELGIYSLLGYRKSTILKLLIFENVMICFGGMILGILTGSILHKIVIAGIVTLLGISVDQSAIPLIYPAAVKAKVTDNGIGFKPFTYKSGSHQGLASIGEQVSLLDGTMNIQPATGGGTAVVISMPMNGGDSYENFVGR